MYHALNSKYWNDATASQNNGDTSWPKGILALRKHNISFATLKFDSVVLDVLDVSVKHCGALGYEYSLEWLQRLQEDCTDILVASYESATPWAWTVVLRLLGTSEFLQVFDWWGYKMETDDSQTRDKSSRGDPQCQQSIIVSLQKLLSFVLMKIHL